MIRHNACWNFQQINQWLIQLQLFFSLEEVFGTLQGEELPLFAAEQKCSMRCAWPSTKDQTFFSLSLFHCVVNPFVKHKSSLIFFYRVALCHGIWHRYWLIRRTHRRLIRGSHGKLRAKKSLEDYTTTFCAHTHQGKNILFPTQCNTNTQGFFYGVQNVRNTIAAFYWRCFWKYILTV